MRPFSRNRRYTGTGPSRKCSMIMYSMKPPQPAAAVSNLEIFSEAKAQRSADIFTERRDLTKSSVVVHGQCGMLARTRFQNQAAGAQAPGLVFERNEQRSSQPLPSRTEGDE